MCGIAVAIDWDDAEGVVRAMIGDLEHRGDFTDPLVSPRSRTTMCTRRLRIVDADHGRQPALSHDGRVLVAFNGEIYNHVDLRRELAGLGVSFRTESDTEVLASALSVWGSNALPRLVGMYAFVALDLRTGDFLAARDPLGVKPLYLVQSGEGFLFSSEIRPLLSATESGEVMLLPPGHLLSKRLCAPFETPFSKPLKTIEPSVDRLDRILSDAVHSRVPPDLPFALMFSGGIDSTLVAHYARRLRPEAPGYFLGSPDASDFDYAARYADQTGLDLRVEPLPEGRDETLALIDHAIVATESFEPCVIRSSLCSYVLAKRIHADGYRVALCGEGADELFAGYPALEAAYAAGEDVGRYAREQYLSGMNRSNLQRIDRCSMRFQLETREPFLDSAVIDYALGCDVSALIETVDRAPRGKKPLRDLYDLYPEALPKSIRDRRKLPFSEGAGFEISQRNSPCHLIAEEAVSDREFADGCKAFAEYGLNNKEELYYLEKLAAMMDISRVPHLKGRLLLYLPSTVDVSRLSEELIATPGSARQ